MRRKPALIVLGVLAFLAISFEVALVLAAEGQERTTLLRALEREADAQGTPGEVKIALLESGTSFSLGRSEGVSRVVWTTANPDGPTVVQCARVRRTWSFLSGADVRLVRLSAPIGLTAGC